MGVAIDADDSTEGTIGGDSCSSDASQRTLVRTYSRQKFTGLSASSAALGRI
jgi:hypothetical protein